MHNLKLRGTKNTRDLGYTSLKTKIREKHLFRSGHLHKLSKKDKKILVNDYNVTTVIDLRVPDEMNKKPDKIMEGVNYVWLPVFTYNLYGITHEKNIPILDKMPDLNDLYRVMLNTEECKTNISKILDFILNYDFKKGAILFHCTEGKDRAGLISIFLLHLLGYDREDIKNDYVYTNVVNHKKSRRYYWLVRILGKKVSIKLANIFLAKEEYFNTVMSVLDNDYGGIDNYISNELKISKESIKNFKERLITN